MTTYAITATATGRTHAGTADTLEAGRSLCGTDKALPLKGKHSLTAEAAAIVLNDRYLDAYPVCDSCRAKVNVAACATL